MKKLILAILFAAFLSLGTAMAACNYWPEQCGAYGESCFWHDTSKGPIPNDTTCCRDEGCVTLCTAGTTGGTVTSTPADTTTPGDTAVFTFDLGLFSQDAPDFHVYLRFPAGFPTIDGSIVVNGNPVNSTSQPNGDTTADVTDVIDGYNGGISGFTSGTNPASTSVVVPIDADYNGPTGPFPVEVGTSGGMGDPSVVPIDIYMKILGLVQGQSLYSSISGIETSSALSPSLVTPVRFDSGEEFFIEGGDGDPAYAYIKFDMSTYQWAATWDLSTSGTGGLDIGLASDNGGWISYDDGDFPAGGWPTGLTKNIYIPAGDVPYAYCCPDDITELGVNSGCTNMFVTYTTETINDELYYVCEGMTGSGGATNGDTNLTINDSAEGSTVATDTAVTFYAYYYNKTSGAPLTNSNSACDVTIEGTNYSMTYSSGNSRWEYDYSSGYSSEGTKDWDVWCATAATGHFNLTASDDIDVSNGAAVPEFSDLGWILACVLGAGGFFIASRKLKRF